jgi:hypothetical protein
MADHDMADEDQQAERKHDDDAAAPATPNPLHIRLVSDPKMRFVLELEFVELLASPQYLQCQSRHSCT